ncbi:MAG: von Willebrand factor type protein, partial [Planctomycetaceae bacterium]|nr:von Willebrand factor type protein [Planctomycetaceae bacterium]
DAGQRPLHEGWLKPGSPEVIAAEGQFEQQYCLGGADLLAACQAVRKEFAALPPSADKPAAVRRRLVILLGSGIDTMWDAPNAPRPVSRLNRLVESCGQELKLAEVEFWAANVLADPVVDPTRISSRFGGQGFFQFGGSGRNWNPREAEVNRHALLNLLTEQTRGRYFDVANKPTDQRRFFEWMLAGLPSSYKISQLQVAAIDAKGVRQAVDVYSPANVLPGETVRVTGRMAAADKIKLSYSVSESNQPGAKQELELTAAVNATDHMVGRYWAEQRLEHLNRIDLANTSSSPTDARDAIVRLSREWSLLTPQTAFLVLETEKEYVTWNVPRTARRQYWAAAGVPPVLPLPVNWLVANAPEKILAAYKPFAKPAPNPTPENKRPEDAQNWRELIRIGQRALAQERYESVESTLVWLRSMRADVTPEFKELERQYRLVLSQKGALADFGLRRHWFDFNDPPATPRFGLGQLLTTAPSISAAYRKDHPLAEALLTEIDLPGGKMTLDDFANLLEGQLGVDVLIDKVKLEEETITTNTVEQFPILHRVSVANALSHVLSPKHLIYREEPGRLIITTAADGSWQKRSRFFPIADLIDAKPDFDLDDLVDPVQDRDDTVRHRIEDKLRKHVKLKYEDFSLDQIAELLREELGENVFINKVKLEEETIASDTADMSGEFGTFPLADALKYILEPKNLTYEIRQEALVITTKFDGTAGKTLKLYPAEGLIHRNLVNLPVRKKSVTDWLELQRIRRSQMSRFMGGFGGGMGGMGGGMGGMGGGMGGMGGGGFGGGGGSNVPAPRSPQPTEVATNDKPIGVSENGVPVASNENTPEPVAVPKPSSPSEVALDPIIPHIDAEPLDRLDLDFEFSATTPSRLGSEVDEMMMNIIRFTGGEEWGAPWAQVSGEGGRIRFFYPSFCFVVRHNELAHQEIETYLKDLRDAQNRRNADPRIALLKPAEIVTPEDRQADVDSLVHLILQVIGGEEVGAPWAQVSGEGGEIFADPVRGLYVRHEKTTLEEVERLLLELRRARYFALHKTRPWEKFRPARDGRMSLLPANWIGAESKLAPDQQQQIVNQATAQELDLLKVRKEFLAGSWTSADQISETKPNLTLQRAPDGRLRVTGRDFEIRLNGAEASLLDFGLRVQEYGLWGQSVREWLDVEIPNWPHRSNQELAELFDITLVPQTVTNDQTPTTQTLRFVPTALKRYPIWIDVTFDLKSGWPTEWMATNRGKTSQHYRFTVEANGNAKGEPILVCTSASSSQQRWMSLADQAPSEIPLPNAKVDGLLNLDLRPQAAQDQTGLPGFTQLRERRYEEAARQFKLLLQTHPGQPLIQFLLAWSLEHQSPAAPPGEVQKAYGEAVRIGPRKFVDFLTLRHPATANSDEFYSILNQQPKASRTLQDELNLLHRALANKYPELAVEHAEAAWNMRPQSEAAQFEIIKLLVKSNLENNNVAGALQWVQTWRNRDTKLPSSQLVFLLDIVEAHGPSPAVHLIYEDLIKHPDSSKLTIQERRDLFYRLYRFIPQSGVEAIARWSTMLQACELLSPTTNTAETEMSQLLGELHVARNELNQEQVSQLIAVARFPLHKQQIRAYWAGQMQDLSAAAAEYWQLYKEGYAFEEELVTAILRLNEAGASGKAVILAESRLRSGQVLSTKGRERLAHAYDQLNRPDAAKRVRSVPEN